MKKTLAIALLTVGNALLTLALSFGTLSLLMTLSGFGIGISVLLLALHVTGAVLLQGVYQRREWLSPVEYWLWAAMPAAGISVFGLAAVMYLDSIGYYTGFFAGLGEFLLANAGLIYSCAFLIVLGAALCVKYRSSKVIIAFAGLAASVGMGILILVLVSAEQNPISIIPLAAVHIAAMTIAQHFMEKRQGLSALQFWLLVSVPAAALTGIPYLIEAIIGNGYDIFTMTFIYNLPAAVLLGAILLIKSRICRRLDNKEG